MPIYEYACEACGAEFERSQRISDDPIKTCPECGARKARRLISRTSFLLKGGGWYKDLYSSPGSGKGSSRSGGSEEKGASKPSESKSDKPAKDSGKKAQSGSQAAA